MLSSSLISPEDTFGVLREPAAGSREPVALASGATSSGRKRWPAATPSIWPTYGWLTGTFGGRSDPFTGEPGFHQGLDIATEKGQPVYATADGTVESAVHSGDYGNLIVLQHEFGLSTRYGHLSRFRVRPGDRVNRGDVIGLRRIDRPLDRRAPALRDPGQRQADQPAPAPDATRQAVSGPGIASRSPSSRAADACAR